MKLLVIINSKAGGCKAKNILPGLKQILSNGSHQYSWYVTNTPQEMNQVILDETEKGIDGVLIAGGDGSISSALPIILKTGLPFGIIPCGRGNDSARNAKLLNEPEISALFPENPDSIKIDIPTANNIPFASVACLGFDALVNELANKPHRFLNGPSIYIWSVFKAFKSFKPFEVEINIDNDIWKGPIMMAAIANGPYYGGGMNIAPEAEIDDGFLNLCIIRKMSKWTLLKEFPKVFRGNHTSHPDVIMKKGKIITVKSNLTQKIYADGEHISQLPLTCSIGEHSIRLLKPQYALTKE